MCLPQIITTTLTSAIAVAANISKAQAEQNNFEYQKQVAISNYNSNLDESYRQKQLGIEEARKEKIEGMYQANLLASKNASSGFSLYSDTTQENYNNIIDSYNAKANSTLENYEVNAEKYANKANLFLKQSENLTSKYNNSLFKNAMTSLGNSTLVNPQWYSTTQGENNGYI